MLDNLVSESMQMYIAFFFESFSRDAILNILSNPFFYSVCQMMLFLLAKVFIVLFKWHVC